MQTKSQLSDLLPFWPRLDERERQLAQSGVSIRQYAAGASVYGGGHGCMGLVCELWSAPSLCTNM